MQISILCTEEFISKLKFYIETRKAGLKASLGDYSTMEQQNFSIYKHDLDLFSSISYFNIVDKIKAWRTVLKSRSAWMESKITNDAISKMRSIIEKNTNSVLELEDLRSNYHIPHMLLWRYDNLIKSCVLFEKCEKQIGNVILFNENESGIINNI